MASKTGNCTICTNYTNGLNWHHTIPQSLGGELSKQIPLCGTCHEILHKKADAFKACISKGTSVPEDPFWLKPQDEERAEYWFKVLLAALLNPPQNAEDKMTLLPSLKVDTLTRESLTVLKEDMGFTNITQVLEYCIKTTLNNVGLDHGFSKHLENNKSIHKKATNSRPPKLW